MNDYVIVNPDKSVEWRGLATSEMDALDRWCDKNEMARYSDTMIDPETHAQIRDGYGAPVYLHEGFVHATVSNYHVLVMTEDEYVKYSQPRPIAATCATMVYEGVWITSARNTEDGQLIVHINTENVAPYDRDENAEPLIEVTINDVTLLDHCGDVDANS